MTTQTAAHTPGLLAVSDREYYLISAVQNGIDGEGVNGGVFPAKTQGPDAKANAARIVACWNALEGLNPDAIADVVAALRDLMETHDEDENMDDFPDEDSVGWGQHANGGSYDLPLTFGHLRRARKALAKLETRP